MSNQSDSTTPAHSPLEEPTYYAETAAEKAKVRRLVKMGHAKVIDTYPTNRMGRLRFIVAEGWLVQPVRAALSPEQQEGA